MIRFAFVACLLASPVLAADSKEVSCGYQADVVAAIQKARLERVKEQNVAATIKASGPTWPENYSAAIPLITPWVYQQKRRDIRNKDLGAVWKELCLKQ